jgi:hypothetical protein
MAELLERTDQLAVLRDCIGAVQSSSRGRLVLVGGEAGVGRLRCYDACATTPRRVRVSCGAPVMH